MAAKNDIRMYLTHNKGRSVVAERFIKFIYKYTILISKNMYINKLDDIVNKYNNTYHSTIKMKRFDLKSSTYTDFDKKYNPEVLNLRLVVM